MNKTSFSALFIAVVLLISSTGFITAENNNAPSISASPNKKAYSPGESGVLTLTFKTGAKIKIPKDPEVTVSLSSGEIEGQGLQDYSRGEGDYISNSKVKYNFSIPANAASGSVLTISGNVKFGYCSTTDGVCKIANRPFTANIKVK